MIDIYKDMGLKHISEALQKTCRQASYEELTEMISNSLLDRIDANLFNVELSMVEHSKKWHYENIHTVFLCNKHGGVLASIDTFKTIRGFADLEDVINKLMRGIQGSLFRVKALVVNLSDGEQEVGEVLVESKHQLAAANDACEWLVENVFDDSNTTCVDVDGVVNELAEAGSPIIFANATHSCQILKIEKITYFTPRKAARVVS